MSTSLGLQMSEILTRVIRAVFRQVVPSLLCAFSLSGALAAGAAERHDEWVYVMRPGDTLIGIAERNFVNPADWPLVQKANGIADPYRIPTGTRVRIPFRLLRPDPMLADVLLTNGNIFGSVREICG